VYGLFAHRGITTKALKGLGGILKQRGGGKGMNNGGMEWLVSRAEKNGCFPKIFIK